MKQFIIIIIGLFGLTSFFLSLYFHNKRKKEFINYIKKKRKENEY